ncbi:MAG: toll/interleukin-1 receptor domain-containing protein [Gaiellaceae bacterium]
MSYAYDFFVSYRRDAPVGDWVGNHFAPLLDQWLNESCARGVNLHVDVDALDPGSEWPVDLRMNLARSRFLIPVLSPSYFRSAWCLAELATMQARERLLGLRTAENPGALIFPVKFNDGEHFAESVKTIQTIDLSPWNQPSLAFAQTVAYIEFTQAIETFAQQLSRILDTAPGWQPDWPVEMPKTRVSYEIALPRIGAPA